MKGFDFMKDYFTQIETISQKAAFIAQGIDLVYDSASRDFNSSEWFIVFDDDVYIVNYNYVEDYVFWDLGDAMDCYDRFITNVIEQSAKYDMKCDVTISLLECNICFRKLFDEKKIKDAYYLSTLFNSGVIKNRTIEKKFEMKRRGVK